MQRMTRTDPSDKQLKVLEFIKYFIYNNGYSPSMREIKEAMGWSCDSTAYDAVNGLAKLGYIRRERHKARSITLTGKEH